MMLCSWNKAIGEEQILSRSIFLSKLLGFVNAARLRLANPNLPPKLQKNNSPLVAGVMSPAGIGETHDASLLPENFDPAFYLRMNPDLGAVDPVHHYLNHGRHDAWRVVTLPLVHRSETHAFNPELDTILVVSHEASRSGAPILALNLVERLSVRYNVVVLLLGNGPLLGAFKNAAVATVSSPALRHNAEYAQLAIQQLSVEFSFQFALVNSMECNLVLEPLARNFIPSVYLIHEFASAYPNSQALLSDTLLWSSEVVFSAGLTQENAQDSFPAFKHFPTHILPQGRCVLTEQKGSEDQARMEADKLREQIRPKSDTDRKFVVFGAGYVNFRKGVDLFIQCAIKAMGSTKRLAELTLQALSRETAPVLFGDNANVSRVNKTRFTMVRFGNVLGSSGSVIPLFHSQIKSGGPLTVTHPKITRYFMTIPEAAQLVIQAGSMGQGGDVFVLDMGEPVRIVELAEKMIHLSGLSIRSERNPQGDISIEFTGLRPGEKLYEELLIGDNVAATPHPMIMTANEDHLPWDLLKARLTELLAALDRDDYSRVRQLLRETVSGYAPDGEIVDWIYQQRRLEP